MLLIGRTHLYTGLLAGAGLACALDSALVPSALMVTAGAIGGVLPELDHRKSKITKRLGIFGFFSSRLFRHRGVLHTPVFYITISLLLLFCAGQSMPRKFVIYGLLAGELSHLLLDAMTPKGIQLLWPFYRRHISLLPIQTDGTMDHVIGRLSLIAAVFLVIDMLIF